MKNEYKYVFIVLICAIVLATLILGYLNKVNDMATKLRHSLSSAPFSGKTILLPKGTELVGEYKTEVLDGEEKTVFVVDEVRIRLVEEGKKND